MATNVLAPAAPATADRRAPWRSPADQPAYARPALLVITVLAAVLYAWGINHSQYHTFYANAVRSMTESWKAFFYGSFDPGNSITLDKLPGFLWPQALSARIFGFHPWALTLPQVVEGVASLLVLHRLVRRWAGVNAALIASTAFLLTPVAVGLFRTAVEDPAFTLCVLLAAEATQRAAQDGRPRPLVLAGVWVGLGFQAKMLEAWAVLPALALVYLVSAPITLRKRLAHLGVSAVVMTAVSVSWMLAVTLTPAKDRPYVDGTTDNSAFSMVVGYNFLDRFSSLGISAASTGSVSATQGGPGGHAGRAGWSGLNVQIDTGQYGQMHTGQIGAGRYGEGGAGRYGQAGTGRYGQGGTGQGGAGRYGQAGTGQYGGGGARGSTYHGSAPATGTGTAQDTSTARQAGGWGGDQNGWAKMFGTSLASQTGWLYPIAAVAVVCGLLWRRGRPRTDRIRSGFILWGTWLTTFFLVFSAGSVAGHTYYMGVIAVPLAALTGGGVVLMWRAYRAGGRRAWALPGTVAATAAWGAYLAGQFPSFLPWLAPVVGVLGLAAVVLLAAARPRRLGRVPRGGADRAGRVGGAGLRPVVPRLRHGLGRPVRHEPRPSPGGLGGRSYRSAALGRRHGPRRGDDPRRHGRLRWLRRLQRERRTHRDPAEAARLHHRPPGLGRVRLRHHRVERCVSVHPRHRCPRPAARRLQRQGAVPQPGTVPEPGRLRQAAVRTAGRRPRHGCRVRRRQRDDGHHADHRLGPLRLRPRPGLRLRRHGLHRPDAVPVRSRFLIGPPPNGLGPRHGGRGPSAFHGVGGLRTEQLARRVLLAH
jgi:4-amino-4-deoxy-L-arabinose transferase-like glycosyltransferase